MSQGVPDLDKRLAEIDHSLRQIQADLLPEREPRPTRLEVEPEPQIGEPPEPMLAATEAASAASGRPAEPESIPPRQSEPIPAAEPESTPPAEPESIPPGSEPPAPETPRSGRSGPLAALLQRSRRPARGPTPPPTAFEHPGAKPRPSAPPAPPLELRQDPPVAGAPAEPDKAYSVDHVLALTQLHAKLLLSMRELLTGYQQVLSALPPLAGVAASPAPEVMLSAGPFASLEAVAEFERALASLPIVREVRVRGYEGSDRALVEVQLSEPTP